MSGQHPIVPAAPPPSAASAEPCRRIIPPRIIALLPIAVVVAASLAFLTPLWETNDDVHMSMLAHGYGISSQPTAMVIYSNVLWGFLISSLPAIGGIFPYSWVALAATAVFGWVIACRLGEREGRDMPAPFPPPRNKKSQGGGVYDATFCCGSAALGRRTLSIAIMLACLVLVLERQLAFPQFSLLAGLAAVAGVLGIIARSAGSDGSRATLASSYLLLFTAALIRIDEAMFVFVISLPLLPLRRLARDREALIGFGVFALAVVAAVIVDQLIYLRPEWSSFNALNLVRIPFTDYHIGRRIIEQAGGGGMDGYSPNDLRLIEAWFFIDPVIADPDRLQRLAAKVDLTRSLRTGVERAVTSIGMLKTPALLPLTLSALVTGAISPHRLRLLGPWGLLLAILACLGFAGRPGEVRVCLPVLALLVVAPLVLDQARTRLSVEIPCLCALIAAAAWNISIVSAENARLKIRSDSAIRQIASLSADELHIVWADGLPYEAVYPVLGQQSQARRLKLFHLDAWTLTPFLHARWSAAHSRPFLDELVDGSVPLISRKDRIGLLATYCTEHFGRSLRVLSEEDFGTFTRYVVACPRAKSAPEPPAK